MSNTHVKNIKLGACKVSFGGVDLGYTKGGVQVEVATETLKVTVDQLGADRNFRISSGAQHYHHRASG